MPRDGSGVYHRPIGTDAVTDTTIESTKYNTFVADVEQDLNTPRPIVAGGTGASDAASALNALNGELARQVVTNYNSAVFQAGSFYSAAGATGAPVAGHAFSGICYVTDASNMYIEARDQDDSVRPGRKYTRQLKGGVWSSWAQDTAGSASASSNGPWLFNNTLTFPPASGQVRFNNASQSLATHVYVSHMTNTGTDLTAVLSSLIAPGGKIFVQDAGVAGNYVTFNVTSVVFTGGDADATVTLSDAGSAIPNGNAVNLTMQPPAGATMYVRYDAPQPLTSAQQAQAQTNMGAASQSYADSINTLAGSKVAKAGDTMSGPLTINAGLTVNGADTQINNGRLNVASASATINLIKSASGNYSLVYGYNGLYPRWMLALGDGNPETGSNNGSHFGVSRYNDAGTPIDTPFVINRASGQATFTQTLTISNGQIFCYGYGGNNNAGRIYLNVGATAAWVYDGSSTMYYYGPQDHIWVTNGAQNMHLQNTELYLAGNLHPGSDERWKKNVQTLGASDDVDQLRVVSFNWISDDERPRPKGTQFGLIAQEVQKVIPELVTEMDDRLHINLMGLVAKLLASHQALQQRVAELEAR